MKKIASALAAHLTGFVCLSSCLIGQTYSYELTSTPTGSGESVLAAYNAEGERGFKYRTIAQDPDISFTFFNVWERVSPPKAHFLHSRPPLSRESKTYYNDLYNLLNAESAAGYDVAVTYYDFGRGVINLLVNHTEGPAWQLARFPPFAQTSLQAIRDEVASKGAQGYLFSSVIDEGDGSAGSGIQPINIRTVYKFEVPRAAYDVVIDTLSVSGFQNGVISRGAQGWRYSSPIIDSTNYQLLGYVFWKRRGSNNPITYHVFPSQHQSSTIFTTAANDEGGKGFRFVGYVPYPDYNDFWVLFSNDSSLGGDAGPAIATQPASVSVAAGAPAIFMVDAGGVSGVTYQWRKNGTSIPTATSAALTILNASSSDAGVYDVVLTSTTGSTVSADATLSLLSPGSGPGRIINVSILTSISSGDAFTMGYVVGGAGTTGRKPLVIRAAGPVLGAFLGRGTGQATGRGQVGNERS